MNLPDGTHLAYIVTHEAYHAKVAVQTDPPYLMVMASAGGGAVAWEFAVTDYTSRIGKPTVRLLIFDDAFDAFAQLPEFFCALASSRPESLDEVREILDGLGAVDETERRALDGGER